MKLEVLGRDGKSTGEQVTLPDSVFGIEPNDHAVYLAVKAQNKNSRQGTAAAKSRSMVRGGGRKPWKQKGRGAARAGTTRSPLWVGGGRVFGPQPINYGMKLSKKLKALARASVYSDKAKSDKIVLVDDFKIDSGKTRDMYAQLKSLGLEGAKCLLLLADYDSMTERAGRNIVGLSVKKAASASTYDLLNCEKLILQKSCIEHLSGVSKNEAT